MEWLIKIMEKEIFPELYKLANIHEDIEDIRGKQAICKEEWLVY